MRAEVWRTTPFRLALRFASLFFLWGMALLGAIYWQTAATMMAGTDKIVQGELSKLSQMPVQDLPLHIKEWVGSDHRHINAYALFDAYGRPLAGNLISLPEGFILNGRVHDVKRLERSDHLDTDLARAAGIHLQDGSALIVARDVTFLLEVREIILSALLWGSVAALVLGLGGAIVNGLGPIWRIEGIRDAAEAIQLGEITRRLPVSKRRDELDLLAGTVNTMLDEMERLLGEVKYVTDAIAHDLRTPLTRLRGHLHRLRDSMDQPSPADAPLPLPASAPISHWAALVDEAVEDTDVLLSRFRALMRISEIEDRLRTTDFSEIDLNRIGQQVFDLYDAVAESKDIRLEVISSNKPVIVYGDGNLLFEAIANLIDNSIKFTPSQGKVQIAIRQKQGHASIEVSDSGPGIDPADRERVLGRFYRGRQDIEGSGLGLSITAAIVRLHRATLTLEDSPLGGLCATLALANNH